MAVRCLRVMEEGLKTNLCSIAVGQFNTEVPDLHERTGKHISDTLKYSVTFWAHHCASTPFTFDIPSMLDVFFEKQLLDWFEVLSVLDALRATKKSLLRLKQWMQRVGVHQVC